MNPTDLEQTLKAIIDETEQRAPHFSASITRLEANGGHTIIQYPGRNFSFDLLSDRLKERIPSLSPNLDFYSSILQTAQYIFLRSLLETTSHNNHSRISQLCSQQAHEIVNFQSSPNFTVEIQILSEITQLNTAGGWTRFQPDRFDLSIRAHQSGVAADEFLKRLRHCSFFQKELTKFSNISTRDDLAFQIELFILSLGLALQRPLQLDNIVLYGHPWHSCPSVPHRFMRRWGAWAGQHLDASTVTFYASPALNQAAPHAPDYQNRTESWIRLLQNVPDAVFPLRTIQRGFWEILTAINNPDYRANLVSTEGMLDVFVGMDGLIQRADGGDLSRPNSRFTKSWKRLILLAPKTQGESSPRKIADKLIALRNVLAHGGIDTVSTRLRELKVAIGDRVNPGNYEPVFVGLSLFQWLRKVLEIFIDSPALLEELYSGQQPSHTHLRRLKDKLTNCLRL